MYVCMQVCVYVCMYYAERKNLPTEILSLSSFPHNVTLCLSPHCNTNSRNFHPTLQEISFPPPRQFMHQLCCTGINCRSLPERALLFKYLPTTLNTSTLVTELSAAGTFSQATLHLSRVKVAAAAARLCKDVTPRWFHSDGFCVISVAGCRHSLRINAVIHKGL